MARFDNGLLLHLGLPKTGTKTLQRACFENHSQLHYLGKHVKKASFVKGCLSKEVYEILKPVIWDVTQPFDEDKIVKYCREKVLSVTSNDKCLIGSWESLGNRPPGTHLKMLDRIGKVFGPCRIIYTLRNPLTQVPSEYLQNIHGKFVKQGRKWMGSPNSLVIDEWFDKRLRKGSTQCDALNYNQNIQASVDLLGKENVGVFLFEDLVSNPEAYYRSISSFIGIDADETCALSQHKHFHKRITQGQLDLIRQCDSFWVGSVLLPRLSSRMRRFLLDRAGKDSPSAKVGLTPALQEKISAETRDGHRWLIENFDLPLDKYDYPL
jgi:hypothetical protein